MRFYNHNVVSGETRVKQFFAFFPVTIKKETRWLEKVIIEQKYSLYWDGAGWYNEKFLN